MRRQRCLPKHKEAAAQAQRQHVEPAIRYRKADSLVQGLAEDNLMVSNSVGRWDRTILYFDVGGMDQGKIWCPRNTSMNQHFADIWRPPTGSQWAGCGWYWIVCVSDRSRLGDNAGVN